MRQTKLNLSLDPEIKELAERAAKRSKRSMAQYITDLVMIDNGQAPHLRMQEHAGIFSSSFKNENPEQKRQEPPIEENSPKNIVNPAIGSEPKEKKPATTSYRRTTKRAS